MLGKKKVGQNQGYEIESDGRNEIKNKTFTLVDNCKISLLLG